MDNDLDVSARSGFVTKLSPIFGFATRAIANRRSKSSKYKTNFPLSLLPKLLVACVAVAQLKVLIKIPKFELFIFFNLLILSNNLIHNF